MPDEYDEPATDAQQPAGSQRGPADQSAQNQPGKSQPDQGQRQPQQGQGPGQQQGPPARGGHPGGTGGPPGQGGGSWLPGGLTWSPLTIAAVIVLVAGVAAAGAFVVTGGDLPFLGGDSASASLDTVPEGVDMVGYMNADVIDDKTTKTIVNGALSMNADSSFYQGPTSYSEWKEQIQSESDLKVDGFKSATMFGKYPEMPGSSTEYVGIIVQSEWSQSDVISTMEQNGQQLEERTYGGKTVYVQSGTMSRNTWIASLGDGTFVLGYEQAVKDTIDVDNGDMSAFSGKLRESFTGLRDGYVKFAATMPENAGQQTGVGMGSAQVVSNLESMSGVYYTTGGDVGLEVTLTATDSSSAKTVKEAISGYINLASFGSSNSQMTNLVNAIEVSKNGNQVTISFQYAAQDLVDMAKQLSGSSALAT